MKKLNTSSASHSADVKITNKILRFRKSERLLHWALAIPFLVCLISALILVIFYNPNPMRPYRVLFSWIHRIFYNIRQAWVWTFQDIKWLFLMGLAAISKKISLPEQGKFNAAEKLNFMYLMTTYPLYIISGLVIWLTDVAFASWILHCYIAIMSLPLIFGHIYMATINPKSRVGLEGMITGFVDRHWAKHHYTLWYREHFEEPITIKEKN